MSQDLVRVFRGLGLVLDQVVTLNKPAIQHKLSRAQFHATELMKVAFEIRNDLSAGSHSVHSNAKTSINESSVGSRLTSNKQEHHEHDIIGFSKVEKETNTAGNTKHQREEMNEEMRKKNMRERPVPATQIERLWGFGSLAARMTAGVIADSASRIVTGNDKSSGISDANAERLAEALCRMRGAALKLGQMLSMQDDAVLPGPLAKALDRVKQAADYMPRKQLEQQLDSQLGAGWQAKFQEFDYVPIAAASIGQVHKAKLLDGTVVAMKIQYPGVADSIDSDLNNLKRLVTMTNALPPGLFIGQIIKVARTELSWECDYLLEAESQKKYRALILADPVLRKHTAVPKVYSELTTNRILTSTFIEGVAIDKAVTLSQGVRNAIARTMLVLTIRELFEWRFIQSDPNFGNFLYDDPSKTINLIDFGASREYNKSFVDSYMRLVWAAANKDSDTVLAVSREVGFLTGDETPEMTKAHVDTGLTFGEPFQSNEPYDFGSSNLSRRIGKHGDVFLRYRLTPPPTEAYSLHGKLAGAILLCIKLKAVIPCRDILEMTYNQYKFE